MIARRMCIVAAGVFCSFCLIACSGGGEGSEGKLDVYKVTGKITLAGNAIPGATVTFSPVDPKVGKVATGRTNDNGEYTLGTYEPGGGAAAGDYVVLVTQSGSSSAAGSPESMHDQYNKGGGPPSAHSGGKKGASSSDSTLPPRYATPGDSDLKATVTKSGDQTFDFDLKP